MICLTRLNGTRFALNPDLIMRADATPDTVLTLTDGTKYLVTESLQEVVELCVSFRARVAHAATEPPELYEHVMPEEPDGVADLAPAVTDEPPARPTVIRLRPRRS